MLGLAPLAVISAGVPFSLQDHRIIVQVFAGRIGPFSMVVDTGSDGLLLTPEAARRIRAAVKSGGSITGAGPGRTKIGTMTVPNLQIGDVRFDKVPAIVADLSRIRRGIGFRHLDGIVGYDQLRRYRLLVDMDRRRLVFSSGMMPVPKDAATTAFSQTDGFVRVPAAVDGVHGTFVVDTGDRSQLTLFRGFADTNDFWHFASVRNALTGFGVGGPVYSDLMRTTLQAFNTTAADVITRLPLAKTGAFATDTDAGSIGNGFLERFNVVYDYPDGKMLTWPVKAPVADSSTFRLPAVPSTPAHSLSRHAVFGAAAELKPGGVTLMYVTSNGPAYRAGLRVGDVVRSMGGRPVTTTADFYESVHDATAGAALAVDFTRDGATRQVVVSLGAAANESAAGVTTLYRDVEVDNSLRRTILTLPADAARPVPAVLVIGGIGCFSVDVAANAGDPYLRLAHDLARAGYAVMRLEKSGMGDSQGPCATVDFEAEMRGYRAALASLQADPSVDARHVFLFGHSIGSVIAPRMARAGGIAGVIVAEAVGRDWPEYELRNTRRQLELGGDAASSIDEALIEKSRCMQKFLFEDEPEGEIEAAMPSCKAHNGAYPVTAWYVRQVARSNIVEPWAVLGLPVLAIYGTSDVVTELTDHQRIVDVANAKRPGSATLVTIVGMSHVLGKASSEGAAANDFDKGIIEPYDSALSDAVISWLNAHYST
ncbi:MAG TPA: alpha/beta fold hydrolase [Candidatus Binatia bacterium]|nr:alpha/beta fold hydrolase [Candidatus Binatia bacterium]